MMSFLKPAMALLRPLTTPQRFVLTMIIYSIPLAAALGYFVSHASRGGATAAVLAISAGWLLVAYLMLCWHVQTKEGYRGVNDAVDHLSAGDLEFRSEPGQRGLVWGLAYQLNTLGAKLAQTFNDMQASAETVTMASKEVAQGHVNLSKRTESQASTLEETAAGMEQLAATVKQNARRCQIANDVSRSASTVAQNGARTVATAAERMTQIEQSSKQIVDIISVIESITFQTNILALNAAVEAARAGDQGRGFAVVAGEVRALAQRSAQAAREIKSLIENSVGHVAEGAKLVNDAGQAINDIVTNVQRVSGLIEEITLASHEQSTGVEEINRALEQMEKMTQQNAALVEQVTAATLSFEQEAEQLLSGLQQFRKTAGDRASVKPS